MTLLNLHFRSLWICHVNTVAFSYAFWDWEKLTQCFFQLIMQITELGDNFSADFLSHKPNRGQVEERLCLFFPIFLSVICLWRWGVYISYVMSVSWKGKSWLLSFHDFNDFLEAFFSSFTSIICHKRINGVWRNFSPTPQKHGSKTEQTPVSCHSLPIHCINCLDFIEINTNRSSLAPCFTFFTSNCKSQNARFHSRNLNWVEDNGKNGYNYNVLLNRKYYTERG